MVDNSQMYVSPKEWTEFPPAHEKARLEGYETYNALLTGEHRQIMGKCNTKQINRSETAKVRDTSALVAPTDEDYVIADYCRMASMIFADILFGKPPVIRIKSVDGTANERIQQIVIDNMLHATNHQQAIMSSALGDAVYRVRWGKMLNWQKEGAIIEPIPPETYFVWLSPTSIKDNKGGSLCCRFNYEDCDYLYREVHEPGTITYMLNKLEGITIGDSVSFETIPRYKDVADEARNPEKQPFVTHIGDVIVFQSDYAGIFVEHSPNWTLPNRYYGISDYSPGIISNQKAINEMLTGVLEVVLKHSDPKLILPPGIFKEDPSTGRAYIEKEDLEAIEVPDEKLAGILPRYVTWDAQLGAAQVHIDRLFETMMMTFQISPAIFGWNKFGTADSAKALKLRMLLTLWRVEQKRRFYDAALKNILYAAQYLDGTFGDKKYQPEEVDIIWPEALPEDIMEIAQANALLVNSKLESQFTAVQKVLGLTDNALDEEIARIKEETAQEQENNMLTMANAFEQRKKDESEKE